MTVGRAQIRLCAVIVIINGVDLVSNVLLFALIWGFVYKISE